MGSTQHLLLPSSSVCELLQGRKQGDSKYTPSKVIKDDKIYMSSNMSMVSQEKQRKQGACFSRLYQDDQRRKETMKKVEIQKETTIQKELDEFRFMPKTNTNQNL